MPVTGATSATATILSGTSLSGSVTVGEGVPVGIAVPPFTSAAITFQESADNVTFYDAVDAAGAEITLGAATTGSKFYPLPAGLTGAYLKVRSGTSAAPVNQGADRTLTLVLK